MRKREHSIDAIKALACLFVPAVHFRRRLQFEIPEELFGNRIQLGMGLVYAIFVIGVPLFLLSTGFLTSKRELTKKYILGLCKIYLLYLVISLVGYGIYVFFNVQEPLTLQELILALSSFSLIEGWYIEMYLGLALLIPFLNRLFNNLSKLEMRYFITMLLLIVALPALVNSNPTISAYFKLPAFWTSLYPILYYAIGAYIKLFVTKSSLTGKKIWQLATVYIASTLLILFIVVKHADPYIGTTEGYYPSILIVFSATSFFLLIYKFYDRKSKIVEFISTNTLAAYLLAGPVDHVIYPFMIELVGGPTKLIPYMPIVVLLSFISVLFLGYIISSLVNGIWEKSSQLFSKKVIN